MAYDQQFRDKVIRMICAGLPGPSACVAPNCECYEKNGKPVFDAVAAAFVERAEAELKAALSRLPDGMKHCTILYTECEKGHGSLTATNWVQHECLACELKAAREMGALYVSEFADTLEYQADLPDAELRELIGRGK